MRRVVTTVNRTVAGAGGGTLVALCGMIFAVSVCGPGEGRPVGSRDTYLGWIVCVTVGPAFGIALAHLCMRRPPADAPKK